MSSILRLRKEHQEAFTKQHGIKLGFMAFFTKAVERALGIFPRVNARIDKDEIVYPDGIHVGIAVSTERGLVVPVVRHVEKLTLAQVEKEIAQLAQKGREGKLTVKDFEGGLFHHHKWWGIWLFALYTYFKSSAKWNLGNARNFGTPRRNPGQSRGASHDVYCLKLRSPDCRWKRGGRIFS